MNVETGQTGECNQPQSNQDQKYERVFRGICLQNRYEIRQLLGQGAFAEIWEALDFKRKSNVAIKMLLREKETKKPYAQMVEDFKIEANLHSAISAKVKKVPKFYDASRDDRYGPYIVMDVLGSDIGAVMNVIDHTHRKMTISCVGRLGCAAVDCLQDLHSQGFIHRDLKPQNLLLGQMGTDEQLDVYLTDFGFAKKHMDPKTRKVVPAEHKPNFRGTAPYSSLRSMRFEDQSRRDDLEALLFLFIELLLGGLPWANLVTQPANISERRERDKKVCEYKETFITKARELHHRHTTSFIKQFDSAYCGPHDKRIAEVQPDQAVRYLPPQMLLCLLHVHDLAYAETPDYNFLRKQLSSMEEEHIRECNKWFKRDYSDDSYRNEVLEPICKIHSDDKIIRDCMDFFVMGVCFERNCKLQHVRTSAPDDVLNTFRGKRARDFDGLGDDKKGPPNLVRRRVKAIRRDVLVAM